MALEEESEHERGKWVSMGLHERIVEWAARHEYGFILGTWAVSMGVAGAIIARDRYQTVPQKVVQARMWAQGLTIGVLIAAGALTHTKRAEAARLVRSFLLYNMLRAVT
jgi:sugar phosphate permease